MKIPKIIFAFLGVSVMLCSCSDDEPAPPVKRCVINFENTGILVGGPSPYGENLYANYAGERFTKGEIEVSEGVSFEFGVNLSTWTGVYEMSGGGMALSQWNHRSDRVGDNVGWWKTYENQLSVYNTLSTDGTNHGAGCDGSNTFAIVYGNSESAASFNLSAGAEYIIENIQICPTAYVYGVITEGNPFGNNPGQHLRDIGGWFKVTATGYDADGNEIGTVEKYLCDYRSSSSIVELSTIWQSWSLSELGKINRVMIDFDGSDMGDYGLNTPSYLAIDNITFLID